MGIARSLPGAGHSVTGIDLDEARLTGLQDTGGKTSQNVTSMADRFDSLFLAVVYERQVQLITDDWLYHSIKKTESTAAAKYCPISSGK